MTDLELNILVGVLGVILSAAVLAAIFSYFNIVQHITKIQEDLANFYTPDILEKSKKKKEEDLNAGQDTTTGEPDSEGSDETPEGDGSESEGDSE